MTSLARPVILGRTTQVWDIRITSDQGKLTCIARCTIAVLETPSGYDLQDRPA